MLDIKICFYAVALNFETSISLLCILLSAHFPFLLAKRILMIVKIMYRSTYMYKIISSGLIYFASVLLILSNACIDCMTPHKH